jgi:hypothetical protein
LYRARAHRLRDVDDAIAGGAVLDGVGPHQDDGHLRRDLPVAAPASSTDDLGHRDAAAPLADVLVPGEQGRLDPGRQVCAPAVEGHDALSELGLARHQLLELLLGPGLLLVELVLEDLDGPGDLLSLRGQELGLLPHRVVGLPGDVDLAGERGVLARRADLGEAALPLLHLVPLGRDGLLLAAPFPLDTGQPVLLGLPELAHLVDPELDLGPPAGDGLCLGPDHGQLDVDLLQLLQRLQLLTQRQGHLLGWRATPGHSGWAHQDSNLDRTGYEPDALPLSYGPPDRVAHSLARSRAQERSPSSPRSS